ncbi:unnamed protein product [Heterobilharzia americana]|nr:unnamed protein product [Heterobilharzia americana]
MMESLISPVTSTSRKQQPLLASSPISAACNSDETAAYLKTIISMLEDNTKHIKQMYSLIKGLVKGKPESSSMLHADDPVRYPLETEDQMDFLEVSLKDLGFRDAFSAKMSRKVTSDIKGSVKHMLTGLLSPALASRYTLIGTPKKLTLCKFLFYKIIRSIILADFSRPGIREHEVMKEIDHATKSSFHDLRDRVSKLGSWNQTKTNRGMPNETEAINIDESVIQKK